MTLRFMKSSHPEVFKGELRQFFHHILISLFTSSTDSPEADRVSYFAQKLANNFK